MGGANTFNYSAAIVCSVVIAILTFFFPLGVGSPIWTVVVIGILLIFSSILYLKREELQGGGSYNTIVGLGLSYVIEVAVIALLPLAVAAKNGSTVLGLKPEDALALSKFMDAYVYFLLFFFQIAEIILQQVHIVFAAFF